MSPWKFKSQGCLFNILNKYIKHLFCSGALEVGGLMNPNTWKHCGVLFVSVVLNHTFLFHSPKKHCCSIPLWAQWCVRRQQPNPRSTDFPVMYSIGVHRWNFHVWGSACVDGPLPSVEGVRCSGPIVRRATRRHGGLQRLSPSKFLRLWVIVLLKYC